MPTLKIERPNSLNKFVELVEQLQGSTNTSIWYRGCGNDAYSLQPTLYRHNTVHTPVELAKLERKLTTRFRQRSIPFHSRNLNDDWDALFFMQHYGVPTRLLDWTENPFVGLHFAVMGAKFIRGVRGGLRFENHAAVWALNPTKWNRHALSHVGFDGDVLTAGDDDLKGYSPMRDLANMNKQPVCMYGAHNSPRIVAQRGVFTIFGQETRPMETAYTDEAYPDGCLVKFKLDKRHLPEIRKAVLAHGTTESVVFPDLDGLAKEIKREFEFEA